MTRLLHGIESAVPTKFNVYKDFDQFKAGDEVFLLTYLGERYFKIRHNGEK